MNIKSIFKGGLFGSNLSDNKSNKLNKKESGFTIVEVMIVIGIGALIIVLVLVAAPALTRSSRNTQRRNDIGSIKGQLLIVTNQANGVYPSLTKFNTDVLAQIKPSIYKTASCSDADHKTEAACDTASATWTPPTAVNAFNTGGAGELKVVYTGTPADDDDVLPGPDELHIITGVSCGAAEFTKGNPKLGGDEKYTTVTAASGGVAAKNSNGVIATSKRHFSFVYQLEGQGFAQCEDNS